MSVHVKKGPVKKDGRQSLFLLIYNKSYHPHKPLRKPLGTYVYASPKTLEERQHNKERLMFAEKVRMEKEAEFDAAGRGVNAFQNQASFVGYFKVLMKEKRNVEGSYSTWKSTYNHLIKFLKGRDVTFKDCDDLFLRQFKIYLSNCKTIKSANAYLSKNSANIYLTKIKAALNQAVKDRIIIDNPGDRLDNIKMEETSREYLAVEEIRKLIKTKCKIPVFKRAFLFSCMTGLRWSDIYKLKWSEVVYFEQDKMWKLHYKQKKTGSKEYLPITDESHKLLGIRSKDDDEVFKGLKYSAHNNEILAKWIKSCGINKHITFHCARHSYAIIMLGKTNNIVTVSKLLGHSNIKTTQIYAKITNPEMNRAVDLFPVLGVIG